MNVYAMKRHWFKTLMGVLAVTALGVGALFSPNQAAAYQAASTPEGVVATITYPDPINVRGGPSTVDYPIVGQLFPGDVVPAVGDRSCVGTDRLPWNGERKGMGVRGIRHGLWWRASGCGSAADPNAAGHCHY